MVVLSPSHDRSRDEFDTRRSRSRSCDLAKERSRSRSVMEEEAVLKRLYHYEWNVNDSEDEKVLQRSRNERHGSRDLVRDDERERSTSYSSRYIDGDDRHYSREKRDRERSWEGELERERKRVKERERSKNMEMNRERRREKQRELSRDREMYTGREERDRRRYEEEGWGGRRKEKERDRSRDRAKVSERDIDRQRDRGRDRDRTRDYYLEKERERERERRSDRSRDKGRDIESDREKYVSPDDSYGNRDRYKHSRHSTRVDDRGNSRDRTRKNDQAKIHSSNGYSLEGDKATRDEEEQNDFEERVTLKLVEQEEEDLDRIKEESRKRRQAILEKYKNQQFQKQNEPNSSDVEKDKKPSEHPSQSTDVNSNIPDNSNSKSDGGNAYPVDQLFSVGKSPTQNGISASDKTSGPRGLGDGSPKSETSNHIFCDDIFGETPTGVRKSGKAEGLKIVRSGLHDNWDDAEGYYSYRFGEMLDGRYEVAAAHGKGVFSTVVRAKDLKASNGEPEEVAIKIIRNNETMNKAGQTEVQILKKLAGADPENKRHCVRFISSFKYRNHLCLVFESLHMNLREVLKKFGRNIGLKLTAVRAYAKQLFIALKHLKNCGVLHCDIKPDNMLVNEAKNVLKLCDFGNAMFAGKNEITPYLVSRFYRAPEIILGLPYDHPLDIWSVGCCLYELYTGKVLFPGATNNDMLRLHMELKGPFPKKMLRKGAFADQHFDQDLNFHATEEDPVTKKAMKRIIFNIKPKDIGSILTASPGEDPKMLANFKDLLEKIFMLDPEKRMTVAQALAHPFISGK
ncbi:Protein kinase-like protein [Melia azedarach]|uniref:Protein kinase-like protein n=1 Tax=Melia azedarach TaxID=155640 RepID=A0ACC1XH92_MELAZ|nr:Protein kinase-like protein [Melia azedarach]